MNCPVLFTVVCSLHATCIFNICARATNNIWKALLIFIPYFKAYSTNDITDQVDQHFIPGQFKATIEEVYNVCSCYPWYPDAECQNVDPTESIG